jgi:transcriptional regulator with XRE-family HTH domain
MAPILLALGSADDFGAALRHHREAARRSLRELADATKLGVRTLEALERNHVEKLPPGIFRRAVVRAYAREVGLDPEDTLRIFLARHPDDLPPPGARVGPVADAPPRPQRLSPVVLACLVAAAVVVLMLAARALGLAASADTPGIAPSIHRGPIAVPGPLAARGESGAGIRPALHPASPPSVLRHYFHHGLLGI